jgi:hypothetical protein
LRNDLATKAQGGDDFVSAPAVAYPDRSAGIVMTTVFHSGYRVAKRILPTRVARFTRSLVTAFVGPYWIASRSGHWRSAFAERAMDVSGLPIPWYTYPCIEFLQARDYSGRRVLEFGGGQSTAWWSKRAGEVVTLDYDPSWIAPASNVTVIPIARDHPDKCVELARAALSNSNRFDLIVIDGLVRARLFPVARSLINETGALIIDNSATAPGMIEAMQNSGLARVDFYGQAPGILLPQCTSILFRDGCFLFDPSAPVKRWHKSRHI